MLRGEQDLNPRGGERRNQPPNQKPTSPEMKGLNQQAGDGDVGGEGCVCDVSKDHLQRRDTTKLLDRCPKSRASRLLNPALRS